MIDANSHHYKNLIIIVVIFGLIPQFHTMSCTLDVDKVYQIKYLAIYIQVIKKYKILTCTKIGSTKSIPIQQQSCTKGLRFFNSLIIEHQCNIYKK